MHARAVPSSRPQNPPAEAPETTTQSIPEPEQEESAPARSSQPSPPARQDLLGALFQDKDRTLILALLVLLSGEGSDHTLLFALMYLLM